MTADSTAETSEQPLPLADLIAAASGDEPALTWRERGERIELGWTTLRTWAEKVAGWLRDDVEREPGDVLAVDAGRHWMGIAAVLGAWRARVAVRLGPARPGEAAVVAEDRSAASDADPDAMLVVGPGGFGAPEAPLAAGEPFTTVVTPMPDASHAPRPHERDVAVVDPDGADAEPLTQAAVSRAAHVAAVAAGTTRGARLASVVPTDAVAGLVIGPLAAWASRGPAVLVGEGPGEDPVALAAAERASLLVARPDQAAALVGTDAAEGDGRPLRVAALECRVQHGAVAVRPA